MKVVIANEFVEIDAQKLENNAKVLSKDDTVFYFDNVVIIALIAHFVQEFEDFDFNSSLVLKLLLVSNDFDSHELLDFVVKALEYLSKGAFTNHA